MPHLYACLSMSMCLGAPEYLQMKLLGLDMEQLFSQLSAAIMAELQTGEHLGLSCGGEHSLFVRFNQARVRQSGTVEEASLGFNLIFDGRRVTSSMSLAGDYALDLAASLEELSRMRAEVMQLPNDPYVVIPDSVEVSRESHQGALLTATEIVEALLPPMQGVDLSGIWASGNMFQGSANSSGGSHWFATDSYALDFSLITPEEKMVKAAFAGSSWNQSEYEAFMQDAVDKMELMKKPAIRIEPGTYRTFIASAGVADILQMFSWHGLSEAAIRQGESAFGKMRNQGATLSPLFSLAEDFSNGMVPRFNDNGEMAPERIELIEEGQLKNTLVSSRTAKEYAVPSNFAGEGEGLRSPLMITGDLEEADILESLGTGVYLSNLHYLNWSDMIGGSITGMTRYACFWVENGEIKAPIENMRFDDSIYRFLGENLEAVTAVAKVNPEVGTYDGREFSATTCPGILLKSFALTL